jgi:hypothetical protein
MPTPPKKPIKLKDVQIKGKKIPKSDPKSVTKSGEVPTRKIDSMRRANPALGRAIGKPGKGSGGMDTYGPEASDWIKKGLKKK